MRRGAALAVALLSASATVKAHEHHMDNIPEGQYVSDDPIVRWAEFSIEIRGNKN
jgi:hypothetical protein